MPERTKEPAREQTESEGARPVRSALQTTLIGGLAAGAAYVTARAISAS